MVSDQGVMGQMVSERKLVDRGLVVGVVVGVPFRAWLLDRFQNHHSNVYLASIASRCA